MISSSVWVVLGVGVSRGAILLATILVAGQIDPSEFGRLSLMITAISLLSGIAGLGLSLAITRQVAEAKVGDAPVAGRYIGSVLAVTALTGAAVMLVMILARSSIADVLLKDEVYGSLVAATGGAVLFTALNTVIQGALTGLESFRRLAVSQWVQGLASGLGLIIGAAASNAAGAMLGFLIGQAFGAAFSFEILHRSASSRGVVVAYSAKREEIRVLFRYGIPTFIASVTVSAAIFGAQFLLSRQPSGYAAVGLFTVSYRWQLLIVFVPACIAPVLVPVMTRLHTTGEGGELTSIFRATMWATLFAASVGAVLIAAAAPFLLGLGGRYYADHPLPLIVLAAASLPAALNNVLSSTAISLGAMRAWLFSDLVLAVVLVGSAALLVVDHDATGLALAYLFGMLATDLSLVVPLSRRLKALNVSTP